MGWKRTARELLHQGPFLALYRDSVIPPGGGAGTYEHVVVEDSVRVVALDGEGRVVLVEDDFYLQGGRALHLPGGGCEGQEPREAAGRELEEETGLRAGDICPLGAIDPLPGITNARTHLFLATDLKPGCSRRDPTETGMTVQLRSLEDAVHAVRAGQITEAGSVAALLLAAAPRP